MIVTVDVAHEVKVRCQHAALLNNYLSLTKGEIG